VLDNYSDKTGRKHGVFGSATAIFAADNNAVMIDVKKSGHSRLWIVSMPTCHYRLSLSLIVIAR